jgi:hypothetical protein
LPLKVKRLVRLLGALGVSKLTFVVSQILLPYWPVKCTIALRADESIAHLLIFSTRYDRVVAGQLGG